MASESLTTIILTLVIWIPLSLLLIGVPYIVSKRLFKDKEITGIVISSRDLKP